MLQIQKDDKKLLPLTLANAGPVSGRYDLRELVLNSPKEFSEEIGEEWFPISIDIGARQESGPRADLLALDHQGTAVVVLLQSGEQVPPLTRAITCSAGVAEWKMQDFLDRLPRERAADLQTFLAVEPDKINARQRAILAGESFDTETLAAAKCLQKRYGLEVECIKVSLAVEATTNAEYLHCVNLSENGQKADPLQSSADSVVSNPQEQRKHPRTLKYADQHLTLDYGGQVASAQLLDLSEGGLGAEMLVPLPEGAIGIGSKITLAGDLRNGDSSITLYGEARVAHLTAHDGRIEKIGISFLTIKYQQSEPSTPTENPSQPAPAAECGRDGLDAADQEDEQAVL